MWEWEWNCGVVMDYFNNGVYLKCGWFMWSVRVYYMGIEV